MGQIGEILGHPIARHDLFDLFQIGTGADQACAKIILLAGLETDIVLGQPEILGCGPGAEERGHPLFLPSLGRSARSQKFKDVQIPLLGPFDLLPVPFPGAVFPDPLDIQHLVNNTQIPFVVEHPLVGGILAVDVPPKKHIGRDAVIEGEGVLGSPDRENTRGGHAEKQRRRHTQTKICHNSSHDFLY